MRRSGRQKLVEVGLNGLEEGRGVIITWENCLNDSEKSGLKIGGGGLGWGGGGLVFYTSRKRFSLENAG